MLNRTQRPKTVISMSKTTIDFNKWKQRLKRPAADLLHLFYPNSCLICDTETPHAPQAICPVCLSELHYTSFEAYTEPTTLDRLFWGRVPLEKTYALLYFSDSASTRAILHALKYKDRSDTAEYFGERVGEQVKSMEAFRDLDALVPVPLHPKKEFLRGYNQSQKLAEGIAAKTGTTIDTDLLKRVVFTESQTKKGKTSRWENMQQRFRSQETKKAYRHIALIDDVVTTGSTVETCVRVLQEILPGTKISVIALAMAK